ncbi:MAG: hypothetical protein LUQ21_03790, partial [Methanothrix sp.]|nr:hypothetical protein [Methanothrix sp.]
RSIYLSQSQVLEREIEAFSGLIMQINELGSQIPESTAIKNPVLEGQLSCEKVHSLIAGQEISRAGEKERTRLTA